MEAASASTPRASDSGNYDSHAIARWQDARSGLTAAPLMAPRQVTGMAGQAYDAPHP
jgi:hypothetical protein